MQPGPAEQGASFGFPGYFVNQMVRDKVYQWASRLQQTLFPSLCWFCQKQTGDGRGLCQQCLRDLPAIGTACDLCGKPMPYAATCGNCLINPPPQEYCLAPFYYRPPLSQVLVAFKYGGSLPAGRMLAELLYFSLPAPLPAPDLLLPVPLHGNRLRNRGFNQAREIANYLGRRLAVPVARDTCVRIKDTAAQAGLSARQRRNNLRGAFRLDEPVAGRRIALIDDVMTTGHTLMELARVLKKGGAERVELWVVCRSVLGFPAGQKTP